MKSTPNYPIWLTASILLGPFLMISSAAFRDVNLLWASRIAGAAMVVIALFYLARKLHEQIEEVAALRERLKAKD
jgi:hypothetical protein